MRLVRTIVNTQAFNPFFCFATFFFCSTFHTQAFNLAPFPGADWQRLFLFFITSFFSQEKTGNVFFMFDSIESDALGSDHGLKSALSSAYLNASEPTNYAPITSAAKIVFRVLGIAAPSDELKCQFAGVLQASVDEMVLSV